MYFLYVNNYVIDLSNSVLKKSFCTEAKDSKYPYENLFL